MKKLFLIVILLNIIQATYARQTLSQTVNSTKAPGFSYAKFSVNYSFKKKEASTYLYFSNSAKSFNDATYNYQGRAYTAQGLGLTEWPITASPMLQLSFDIFYKGKKIGTGKINKIIPPKQLWPYGIVIHVQKSNTDRTLFFNLIGVSAPFERVDLKRLKLGNVVFTFSGETSSEVEQLIMEHVKDRPEAVGGA